MKEYIEIKALCKECDTIFSMQVDKAGLAKFDKGLPLIEALPELAPAQRDLLTQGVCEFCWERHQKSFQKYGPRRP